MRSGQSAEAIATYPNLDFNDPHLRRVALGIAALTVINVVVLATSSVVGLNFMDTPKFCGTVCHKVMRPEYTAYQNSPHSRSGAFSVTSARARPGQSSPSSMACARCGR